MKKVRTINDYEKRIIAFVDILGFKNLVDRSTSDHYTYLKIHDALKRFREEKAEEEDTNEKAKVTTFSDSLVISYPVNYTGGLYQILLNLTVLQFELLQMGIFVRGGITIGELRHVQDEIFGPAMNSAYKLESETATFPRIIIEEATINQGIDSTYDKDKNEPLNDQNNYYRESKDIYKLLKKDSDNRYSLDYLRVADKVNSLDEYYHGLERVYTNIKDAITSNRSEEHVLEKYVWLANYYNAVVSTLEQEYGPNQLHIIEVDNWIDE